MKPLDILIFGAHPDDAEIGMGATIAKHAAAGYKVGICDLTYAEMSSNGSIQTRQDEAGKASELLGISARTNLGLPDRGLQFCSDHIEAITAEIRRCKPQIIFAPYWEDRHPDHIMCSKLVQEAVFNAKLRKYLPEIEAVTVQQCFFYFINDVFEADISVDVSDCYEIKSASLKAYKSQFEVAGSHNDYVATPINQGYLERVEARDRVFGQKMLVRYAEGFVTKNPFPVNLF